jgi:hypothetical protein
VSTLLEALGEPADCIITLDFESYYSKTYGLKRLTTEQYIRDTRFEVIGVGVKVADGPSVWLNETDFRRWARNVDWSRCAVLAHHAHFDLAILSWYFGIRPGFILDTLSMARMLHGSEVGGSLAKLALHYDLGHKGTEVLNALGKRLSDFTLEDWLRYGGYCCNDVDLTYALFWKLLPHIPEVELWLIDTTVRMFTEPKFVADPARLQDALLTEKEKKATLLERVGITDRGDLLSNDKFAEALLKLGVEPPRKISLRTGKEAWAFAKSDDGMKALLEHDDEEVRWLTEARVGIKSTIVETRTERLLGIHERGPIPIYLKFAGAHTGRWSGADKMNPQNFNRGGALRAAMLAPEGEELVVVDSKQIEPRVTAWMAQHELLLNTFRTGEDLYCTMGSVFFNRPVREGDPERQIAKAMVIGLGYGMGPKKFASEMLKGLMGMKPVLFTAAYMKMAGLTERDLTAFAANPYKVKWAMSIPSRLDPSVLLVHCAIAEGFVKLYREANPQIVGLWETMDKALYAMWRGEEFSFGPEGCCITGQDCIRLPSGRYLRYPGLDFDGESFSYLGGKRKGERVKIYGGLMVENVIQAIARDVVAEQMLWIRSHGYPILTMTHDEAVAAATDAPGAFEVAKYEMGREPPWIPGLPLGSSGGYHRSYGQIEK